ncbi:ParB family chromosome partitioning protein [Pullulanibacillus pueri]|uniref:Nucleoid occlusion protein n=1 Tax=Pullulanibacillus pueri TaxID=1437324 RepID=A0A8J3EME8_9BACL|nr:nucleoid occlusion protein [Pullulanibacillus pueri]MBM7682174.1 ParB family chromosome partitioning protein [Pullulanibacillus pueri]GGH80322.1 nucleoid occlusion protein [Pullulanibacillus pueri]
MKQPFSKFFGQGDKPEVVEDWQQEQVKDILVENIIPNRYQPRTVFNEEKIEELAHTIETHGLIQPIVIRQYEENKYEIIAGERRWRAANYLGWKTVPAIIKEYDDAQTAAVALIENLQREELTAIEEAMAYAKLMDIHGLTQESLAQKLGKGQSTIANKLRLLKLPTSVQNALLEKKISERHARALILLKNDPEKQEKVLNEIIEKELNVKQTELRIKSLIEKVEKQKPKRRLSLSKDMRIAVNTIRQSVGMVSDTGLKVDTNEEDLGDYYQFTIRIPKK